MNQEGMGTARNTIPDPGKQAQRSEPEPKSHDQARSVPASAEASRAHAAPLLSEREVSTRPAIEADNSRKQTSVDSGKVGIMFDTLKQVAQCLVPRSHEEQPEDHRRREQGTGSRQAPKVSHTSGDGNAGRMSRGNDRKLEEEECSAHQENAERRQEQRDHGRSGRDRDHSGHHGTSHHNNSRPTQFYKDREREYRERNKVLSAALQRAEAQSDGYRLQIEKMAQINQHLARQGLPLPPADDHFSREFDQLWSDIGQWARLASRTLDPITAEIWRSFSTDIHELINPAFANLQELLVTNPPRGLRTRFIELIIFKYLQACIFGRCVLGLSQEAGEKLAGLQPLMLEGRSTAVERDVHCWNALSIYLLTKDNETFQANREMHVSEVSEGLMQQLTPLGAPGRATLAELRQIVLRAADIGLQVAQLPFGIRPFQAQPGMLFQQKFYEGVDNSDLEPEELELLSVPIDLVLFPPVVKLQFDSEGKRMNDLGQATVISKGRVICYQ
ncbi:hypothetical protein EV426DRAFT_608669 [Tirmania nivea]|nr:hypothetical protein EV426DRAFT_608669 [Tirmania nivea]